MLPSFHNVTDDKSPSVKSNLVKNTTTASKEPRIKYCKLQRMTSIPSNIRVWHI